MYRSVVKLQMLSRVVMGVLTLAFALFVNAAFTSPMHAQTYQVIHNFVGSLDGSEPTSGVTIDSAGNLYGTTFFGDQGTGTFYKMSHRSGSWLLSPLYYFTVVPDGVIPYARPIIGPDGAFYLTTGFGGVGPCVAYNSTGCGTVVSMRPLPTPPPTPVTPWLENVLYRFTGGADGANPYSADLVFDPAGNIYGTAYNGGSTTNCTTGCGVVYKMTKTNNTWTESVVYTFTGGTDGSHPWAGVTRDSAGNLYGTTSAGGAHGFGTVYELSPSGSGYAFHTLYSFQGQADGGLPYAGLIFDQVGNLYGATSTFGTGGGGTVFELSPSGGGWNFNILYSFTGPFGGFYPGPVANLAFDTHGNLYGTTHLDGLYSFGAIFKLTPSGGGWTYTSLHDFTAGADGGDPRSNVSFDASGNMYGTAAEGGTGDRQSCVGSCGVVWQITP